MLRDAQFNKFAAVYIIWSAHSTTSDVFRSFTISFSIFIVVNEHIPCFQAFFDSLLTPNAVSFTISFTKIT